MLKRYTLTLLAATAIGVVISQGASAADMGMPVKAPPMAPAVPLFNWTGVYVGGFFGGGISHEEFSSANNSFGGAVSSAFCNFSFCGAGSIGPVGSLQTGNLGSHTGVGPLGGFTLGYRYQPVGSPWLVGIEGQFAFADIRGSHNSNQSASEFFGKGQFGSPCPFVTCLLNVNTNNQISSQTKDIATIAGVFGVTSGPQDRTLWYVKGGPAWKRTSYSEFAQCEWDEHRFPRNRSH